MATQNVVLRKRQEIANANKTMFVWVAITSAIVGISLVASIFLLQKALFNEKVLTEKAKTANILVKNNKAIAELKNQVRVLNTNDNLKSAMAPGETQPIQVVLDALPSVANSSAFGASLQKKFLSGDGVSIDSLIVDPVVGVESSAAGKSKAVTNKKPGTSKISFRFTVSADVGNANALKRILTDIERSIRPIDVTTLIIEAQGKKLSLKITGETYYEPAMTADLKDKVVKP